MTPKCMRGVNYSSTLARDKKGSLKTLSSKFRVLVLLRPGCDLSAENRAECDVSEHKQSGSPTPS